MKNIQRYLRQCWGVIAATAVILLPSCSKLLNQEPQNRPYDQVFWKTQKDAVQAISGDYALLRKALTVNNDYAGLSMSHFAYGDLSTGIYSEFREYAYDFLVKGDQYYGTGLGIADFIGDYIQSLQNWTPHYKTIAYSNTILAKVGEMPVSAFNSAADKNKILGEALFIRAFSYFYMVRIWGDVPLVLKYDPQPGVGSPNVPRTSELVVLDSCIKDVMKAIEFLPWEQDANEKAVRANKGAANALLAHIYMWKDFLTNGTDASNAEKAIAAIDEITTKGSYALVMPEYARLFRGKSEEGIFEINMSGTEQQIENGFFYHTLNDRYINRKTDWYGRFNVSVLDQLFSASDLRRNAFFDFSNPTVPILVKYCGRNKENINYQDVANAANASVNVNLMIFRLADVKLLRAEANAKLKHYAPARVELDEIRARAGLTASTATDDQLYRSIITERRRELFCEGQTWYDLVRSKLLPELVSQFPADRFTQQGWKWPVGRALFLNNQVLTQNAYWEGRVR